MVGWNLGERLSLTFEDRYDRWPRHLSYLTSRSSLPPPPGFPWRTPGTFSSSSSASPGVAPIQRYSCSILILRVPDPILDFSRDDVPADLFSTGVSQILILHLGSWMGGRQAWPIR